MKLTAGQEEANHLLAGPQRHTCLVGGSRSGKTTLIVRAIVVRAGRAPRTRHAILRLRSNAARASIALDTLPKVMRSFFPGVPLIEHRQDGYFSLPNGSEIWIGGLDDKDRVEKILGQEYATLYLNECSQIPYGSVLVARTRLAQKSPLRQRAYYDLNPAGKGHWTNLEFGDKRDPLSRKDLPRAAEFARMFLNPADNAENLSPEYLQSLEDLPLRQRRRFYEGAYVDELDDALWTYEIIERNRVDALPVENRQRVVVAVDPSGAANASDDKADEIGIIVAALGTDGHGYIIADRSMRASPAQWGRAAVTAFHEFSADSIIGEKNFGGEMVRFVINAAGADVPVRLVTASRGKAVRAEPISAFYEKNRIHHVGEFKTLEEQMCAFTTAGYRGEDSPDHVDAMVWALTGLMVGQAQDVSIGMPVSIRQDGSVEGRTVRHSTRPPAGGAETSLGVGIANPDGIHAGFSDFKDF